MSRTLVLIRHGSRDSKQASADNGLNETGKTQAENLVEFFRQRFSKTDAAISVQLLSSPKKRCQETLAPLAKALKLKTSVDENLDESNKHESDGSFEARVSEFLLNWRESPYEITIACTHGDWIPFAVELSTGQRISPEKGSWTELELGEQEEKDHRILFRKIVQAVADRRLRA